jgi:hypothetical protein
MKRFSARRIDRAKYFRAIHLTLRQLAQIGVEGHCGIAGTTSGRFWLQFDPVQGTNDRRKSSRLSDQLGERSNANDDLKGDERCCGGHEDFAAF